MSYDLNVGFANAIRSCRLGKSKPVQMSAGASGKLFHDLAQSLIKKQLNKNDYNHYCTLRDLSREAVKTIHNGNLNKAREQFTNVDIYLSSYPLSDEVEQLSQSWKHQGLAYLEIREKNFAQARLHLNDAMLCDYALEKNYHYQLFHVARIHLVHLFVRLEAAEGNSSHAIDLAQNIIDYVIGLKAELSVGEGWSITLAKAIPEQLRLALLTRIASEVGTILSSHSYLQQIALFSRVRGGIDLQNDALPNEISEWYKAKQVFLAGDTHKFLEFAAAYLILGRRETTLWYALVLDLLSSCQSLRTKQTQAFRDEIIEEAKQWQSLPVALFSRGYIQNYAKVENTSDSYRHQSTTRQFQAYTVGLPRTGTTSIFALFKNYRSANEYMEQGTVSKIVDRHNGAITAKEFEKYILLRDREGSLEMDSASFNHFYLELLLKLYPEAKFIYLIREPYAWMNSYVKMLMRWRLKFEQQQKPIPVWMTNYGQVIFKDFSWTMISSVAAVKDNKELLAENLLAHWTQANQSIIKQLPTERTIIIKTQELSSQRSLIAEFMQISPTSLTPEHHANRSPDQTDLFKDLSNSLFEDYLNNQGNLILNKFF